MTSSSHPNETNSFSSSSSSSSSAEVPSAEEEEEETEEMNSETLPVADETQLTNTNNNTTTTTTNNNNNERVGEVSLAKEEQQEQQDQDTSTTLPVVDETQSTNNNNNNERVGEVSLAEEEQQERQDLDTSTTLPVADETQSTNNTNNNNNNERNHPHHPHQSFQRTLSLLASPLIDESGSAQSVVYGLSSLFLIGTSIGIVMPKNQELPTPWYRTMSACIGYIYFSCWSISFYPQVISNYKRQSTVGLSADFCGLNVLGFACYTIYTVAFYTSPTIHRLYQERYGTNAEITVQSNDVAFAIHALILSSCTLLQIAYYNYYYKREEEGIESGNGNDDGNATTTQQQQQSQPQVRPSFFILTFIMGAIILCTVYPVLVIYYPVAFNWLDYLYLLSYIKIAVSLIKYIPQVLLNYQRKSTVGWSIWNILLDFSGGILSDLQLLLDCTDLKDFSGITGNLAKFGLGSISIVFDIIFMVQHYILYNVDNNNNQAAFTMDGGNNDQRPEAEPLLLNHHPTEEVISHPAEAGAEVTRV